MFLMEGASFPISSLLHNGWSFSTMARFQQPSWAMRTRHTPQGEALRVGKSPDPGDFVELRYQHQQGYGLNFWKMKL